MHTHIHTHTHTLIHHLLIVLCVPFHLLRIWDVSSTRSIADLEGHRGYVSSVVFSPDGAAVLSGSRDNTIK